jgi:hypothetical protein
VPPTDVSDAVDAAAPRHGRLTSGYESYYLRATAPSGGLGFWLRHTVQVVPGRDRTASTWFTLFDRTGGPPRAVRHTAPAADVAAGREGGGADPWLAGAGGSIGPGRTQAVLGPTTTAPTVSWDLSFTGEPALLHLDHRLLYRARLPRTKAVSIHPAAGVSGVVSLGDRSLDVQGWPGMVGHNWGSEHAERWIWVHAAGLESASGPVWIDVVLARVRVGRLLLPWTVAGAVSVAGRRSVLGGLARSRKARVTTRPGGVTLHLPGAGVAVDLEVSAPPDQFVGWVYADPDGTRHEVVNCSVADAEVTLRADGRPAERVRATGTVAYELGSRGDDPGIEGVRMRADDGSVPA